MRLVGAVDAVREEHPALPHGQRRVRAETPNRLLREHELAEDDAGGSVVSRQRRCVAHDEAPAFIGRAPDPEAVCVDAGDVHRVTCAGGQGDELRLDELAVDHLGRRPAAPAVGRGAEHGGLVRASQQP